MLALPVCCGSLVAISYLVTAHATTILSKVRVFSLLISSDLIYFVYAFVVLNLLFVIAVRCKQWIVNLYGRSSSCEMSATAAAPVSGQNDAVKGPLFSALLAVDIQVTLWPTSWVRQFC